MLPVKLETEPFLLKVPVLEDEAVDALHTFLLDLLTQFENHYFGQLHRYRQYVESVCREAPKEKLSEAPDPADPADKLDDELNEGLF
jgi:hypothetical protein